MRAHEIIGAAVTPGTEIFEGELRISAGRLGSIAAALDSASVGVDRENVSRAVSLLASSVRDVCEAQVNLRARVRALDAMNDVLSLMVRAGDPDELLGVVLRQAMEIVGTDAGSVAVRDERSGELIFKVSEGLSHGWILAQHDAQRGRHAQQSCAARRDRVCRGSGQRRASDARR